MARKAASARVTETAPPSVSLEEGNHWLDDFLPYLLYRVSGLMSARLQGRLNALGINPSEWRVLSVLRSFGRLNISGIVHYTLMEQPTASRLIANMQKAGLVHRRPSPGDSRVVEVSLTAKGLHIFEETRAAATRHQFAALDGIDQADVAKLQGILKHLEKNLLLDL